MGKWKWILKMLLILFVFFNLFELMQEYVLKVRFVSNDSIFCVGTISGVSTCRVELFA